MRPTLRIALGFLGLAACEPLPESDTASLQRGPDRVAEIEAEQLDVPEEQALEHEIPAPSGVFAEFTAGPTPGIHLVLVTPTIEARFVNLDFEPRLVRWQLRGDDGTQNRRVQTALTTITVPARSTANETLTLNGLGLTPRTFSGLASLAFEECALDGTDCVPGTALPLYFHRDATGLWRIYGSDVLCASYGCGDVFGGPAEPGTARVLGGTYVAYAAPDEEPDEGILPPSSGEPDDNDLSEGGVQ